MKELFFNLKNGQEVGLYILFTYEDIFMVSNSYFISKNVCIHYIVYTYKVGIR